MAIRLVFWLGLVLLPALGAPTVTEWARGAMTALAFDRNVLEAMLSVLLFAGAFHVRVDALERQWRVIGLLATAGVLACTGLIGLGLFLVQGLGGWICP